MFSFSYLESICCSMFSSNCCFLTCIQVSQEAGQVVWYPISFRIFHSLLWPTSRGKVFLSWVPLSVGTSQGDQWQRICMPVQEIQETWVWSLGREGPLEEGMTPTAVLLPGESHGQRSLAGYSPWGHKELDMTEATWHTYRSEKQKAIQTIKK